MYPKRYYVARHKRNIEREKLSTYFELLLLSIDLSKIFNDLVCELPLLHPPIFSLVGMLSEAPARHDLNGDIWPISICDIDHNTATKKYQRRGVDITLHDNNVHY